MYNLKQNNYHSQPKSSTVYTPKEVSEFLFNLLKDKINKKLKALDPCSGQGSLTAPWKRKKYSTIEIDSDPDSTAFWKKDFLQEGAQLFATPQTLNQYTKTAEWTCQYHKIGLVICNPPFNGMYPKLAPEVWLDKIIELFGKDVPIVLFVPAGFTLNLTLDSPRYLKFSSGTYPPITSRISLPRNIFKPVIFHSEILIFNIQGLAPHYFFKHYE